MAKVTRLRMNSSGIAEAMRMARNLSIAVAPLVMTACGIARRGAPVG
jgi:hypothetical protein